LKQATFAVLVELCMNDPRVGLSPEKTKTKAFYVTNGVGFMTGPRSAIIKNSN
jgi:hypothetical protein